MCAFAVRAGAEDKKPVEGGKQTMAELFGQREQVRHMQLSPDGKHAVYVTPGPGMVTYAGVIDIETREMHAAGRDDGKPLSITSCGWASNTRIVCQEAGTIFDHIPPLPITRTIAVDTDGKHPLYIGKKPGLGALRVSQFDGDIVDWGNGDGTILMSRDYVPEGGTGGSIAQDDDGLGVDRVDTVTAHATNLERAFKTATSFLSDGQGNVRMRASAEEDGNGALTGGMTYAYRQAGERQWRIFSRTKSGSNDFTPIAIDGTRNVAYAVKTLDGRDALYSVALDGSFKADLVASNPEVDVNNVATIGRHGRVIGASYTTDRDQTDYFDPDYKKLHAALVRAMPQTPLIEFLSASADEQKLLVYMGSDTDPGRYYIFDRANHHLDQLLDARPALVDIPMAPMRAVSFKAADGTVIPAYLTLPIGDSGKGLPAIVMPHGGPSARDSWGFDWLVQFFAQRGYAVLQPEYRGSSGYGDAFYKNNGFHSWQTAMADICDAGRWLVHEGIADPSKLAIVGWSYGGYAALQTNVVEPNLFKAIVAIAPVTDLGMMKSASWQYTDSQLVRDIIGTGAIVGLGSPARHADHIQAPVLMFHGDHDMNVGVDQSRAMDVALRKAGKRSTLVIFPGLDHQLNDSDARTKMLDQSDAFLRSAMNM